MQHSDSIFTVADQLFKQGRYRDASIAYERIIYEAGSSITRTKANLRKANCLKQMRQFAKAQKGLERINYFTLNDSLHYRARYETALCAYLAGNFSDAESQLLQMDHFVKNSALKEGAVFLRVLVLNELHKWEEAKSYALVLVAQSSPTKAISDSMKVVMEDVYSPKNIPRLKKSQKAELLYVFFPGLGQLYLGYPGEGITSFFMNLSAVGFIALNVFTMNYFTAFAIGLGVLQIIYLGGLKRVQHLAGKRNYEVARNYNDRLKALLLAIYGME